MSSDLSGWLHLCGLPCLWGRRVSWGEKNKKAQREIHQKQQHLTNKARTSPSAAAAVKCFCAFVSPFRHCTVMLHPCLLPFFAAAAVVPLPPSLPPLFSPTPSKSPFLFESSSTSGGGRSPRNCFCSLRQNRFQTGWGTTQGSCDDSSLIGWIFLQRRPTTDCYCIRLYYLIYFFFYTCIP